MKKVAISTGLSKRASSAIGRLGLERLRLDLEKLGVARSLLINYLI
jgi:hypothetical protein